MTGHTPDGSGLQQHSIGGLYPYIIVYRPYSKTFEVSHRDGITRSTNHTSYDVACEAAGISKALDALVGKRVADDAAYAAVAAYAAAKREAQIFREIFA